MKVHNRARPLIAILAVLSATVLAACGSSSSTSQTASAGGGSTATTSAASGGYGSGYGAGSSSTTASSTTTAAGANGATVRVVHSSIGPILVDSRGFTLYLFTADGHNSDRCVKVSGCTGPWPPLKASGKLTAGSGAKSSLLGTTAIPGGKQVTYAGHPLYGYTGDGSPASTSYVGISSFGGTWYAVSASGQSVH